MKTFVDLTTRSIGDLMEDLRRDPWREQVPFSDDIKSCQRLLFNPASTRGAKADALAAWLRTNQPCLFGRMAARDGQLSYCILSEADIAKGDDHLRQVIQDARLAWKQKARSGGQHGFIILAVSEELAYAEPCPALQGIAVRLCELYLSRRPEPNEILHDSLYLHIKAGNRVEPRKWPVGVNAFAAQGDQRWWHDHRIPGGIAFSMNSVGHMARTKAEAAIIQNPALTAHPAEALTGWALYVAMLTIDKASRGAIPGTRLAPVPSGSRCLVGGDSPPAVKTIAGFRHDYYYGWYHTDQTVPAEYFEPRIDRAPDLCEQELSFTYLYDESDPDYLQIGLGIIDTLDLQLEKDNSI